MVAVNRTEKDVTLFILMKMTTVSCFWDIGTTTSRGKREDEEPRTSFFRWQWTFHATLRLFFGWWDWDEIEWRRKLNVVAGLSIEFLPLTTATILNRRILLTAYNPLDPYMNRQRDIRIWALGRAGRHNTPFRYRVWTVNRLVPLSYNPEHCHGPYCQHQPRHDVALIITFDMMYLYQSPPNRFDYAYRAFMIPYKQWTLQGDLWSSGSGFEYMEHILENYKIFYMRHKYEDIVDCSKYLPKWWGKFICLKNTWGFPGIQDGGGFYAGTYLVGIGCFEIRYNEVRLFVITDLRYYYDLIYYYADIWPGQYYEYAYPQWGVYQGWIYEGHGNNPQIPAHQIMHELYPMG